MECNDAELNLCPIIAGERDVRMTSQTSLVNSRLTRAEGGLYFQSNNGLLRVDFAALISIGGGLTFYYNAALVELNFASLASVGDSLLISGNPALSRAEFPSLSFVGYSLNIRSNRALTFLSVPLLSQVLYYIDICENHDTFALPQVSSTFYRGQDDCNFQPGGNWCDGFQDICP
jgi:hypothetical protein